MEGLYLTIHEADVDAYTAGGAISIVSHVR
jgi:hypothetical protein